MPARFLVAVLAIIAAASVSAAKAQFKMDMSAAQIRKATSTPALADLAVGEVGTVQYATFCNSNGQLFVAGETPLATSKNGFAPTYLIKHEEGGTYAITASPGPQRQTSVAEVLSQLVQGASQINCASITALGSSLLPVGSVNGFGSASQIIVGR